MTELLVTGYQHMVLTRTFDEKMVAMQRTGQMGTYAACLGQEAIGTAVGMTLSEDDVFVPYYRDQAAQLWRGVSMTELMLFWGGDERGSDYQALGVRQDLPNCVPIATQFTHAAGIAWAIRLKRESRMVMVTGGDGSTSRGDFYESLNFAGVHRLPMVFVINNNQWAISVPLRLQTAAETLAQKAVAAGVEGLQVDGNDLEALLQTLGAAREKALAGEGPVLVEACSYRLGDHTTADDASRYRDPQDLKAAWDREPLVRLRSRLHDWGLWDEAKERALRTDCQTRVGEAVEAFLATEPEPAEAMFAHLYDELPEALYPQQAQLKHHGGGRHDD
jgi:pyruvate dehydrogenase E1 component alpha subunit